MGTDMTSASMTLGKALNDPIKGMSKLTKQGVTFTDAQKEQVKAMAGGGRRGRCAEDHPGRVEQGVRRLGGGGGQDAARPASHRARVVLELRRDAGREGDPVPDARDRLAQGSLAGDQGGAARRASEAVQPVLDLGRANWSPRIVTLIMDNWGTIGPIVEAVFKIDQERAQPIGSVIKLFAAILSGDWSKAWDGGQGDRQRRVRVRHRHRSHAYANIGGLLLKAVKAITDAILDGVVAGLKALPGLAWDAVKLIGAKYVQMYVTIAMWGFDLAKQIVGGVVDGLVGIGLAAWNVINNIGEYIVDPGFPRSLAWGTGSRQHDQGSGRRRPASGSAPRPGTSSTHRPRIADMV